MMSEVIRACSNLEPEQVPLAHRACAEAAAAAHAVCQRLRGQEPASQLQPMPRLSSTPTQAPAQPGPAHAPCPHHLPDQPPSHPSQSQLQGSSQHHPALPALLHLPGLSILTRPATNPVTSPAVEQQPIIHTTEEQDEQTMPPSMPKQQQDWATARGECVRPSITKPLVAMPMFDQKRDDKHWDDECLTLLCSFAPDSVMQLCTLGKKLSVKMLNEYCKADTLPMPCRMRHAVHVCLWLEQWQQPPTPLVLVQPKRGMKRWVGPWTKETQAAFASEPALRHHWAMWFNTGKLRNKGIQFERTVQTDGVSVRRGIAEQREFVSDPATQIGVGIDPGVTQAVSAASGVWDVRSGQLLADQLRRWKLTKGQVKHASGLNNSRRDTERWLAPIKPHLLHLAAASSAGTSLVANLKHITFTLATWDAVWEVYMDSKWAQQRLQMYGAQDRALEQFLKKLEKDMAEVSMQHHRRAKQLVVFFGAASIGTGGGPQAAARKPRRQQHQSLGPSLPPQPSAASAPRLSRQLSPPSPPRQGKAKGKAAKAKPAPQPVRWLDRDCNVALNMQRIGESRWRPLELCYWPALRGQGALPATGKEYPGLGYKRLRDKPPKAQQQQPAEAHTHWATYAPRQLLADQLRRWKLTKGQVKHASGLNNSRRDTERWLAPIKPHLLHLAAASSAGTSLVANLKHITFTLATWDAVWEVYMDSKWAQQRLQMYGAQDRALEHFLKKLEKDMAEVSMQHHRRAKQLVVFFGAASIGTGGGWGADAVLRACCKVGALPAKGKEYPGLGYKRLRDKPPKAQQQLAVAQ
ncbi:hypothetical protein QJQ45_000879 [Haematococcus lacustris]|nr:hypothetical protein QJQ45_000879 [Haematococcus lacustris]